MIEPKPTMRDDRDYWKRIAEQAESDLRRVVADRVAAIACAEAAQARIVQLEAHVAELQAEVDAQPVTITTRSNGDYQSLWEVAEDKLAAAEATIARVKRLVRAWDAVRVHGGIYSQREAQLVDDLESALAGPKDGEP